ncbi:MAG: carboxypeptidase regulatory-like domain-containing protein [Pyrinomonadaceae bacterium]|nr:carboxypeptidase regulatory-like domain-containing protein [Pyrinomonadaceae bacterium]
MNEQSISVFCRIGQNLSKTISKIGILSTAILMIVSLQQNVNAQFNTATPDGTVNVNEYGVQTNGQNQETSGEVVWNMTWDDTNLYIAVSGADTRQAAILYLDINPSTTNGNTGGQSYDGTDFASLPFPADFVVFFRDGYNEYRNDAFFSNQVAQTLQYGSSGGNVREISIPWSAITGSVRPTTFRHAGYVTTMEGFVYGQLPTTNSGGNIGTNAVWTDFYNVCSTMNNTMTKPYSSLNGACSVTAAGATLQGRVVANGRGISKARVSIVGSTNSLTREVRTNSFGYFTFTDLPTGDFYIVDVRDKRYVFENNSQGVQLQEDSNLIFTGSRR